VCSMSSINSNIPAGLCNGLSWGQSKRMHADAVRGKCERLRAERQGFESRADALLARARAGGVDWREVRKLSAALEDSVERGVWTYREVWLDYVRGRLEACADASADAWDVLLSGAMCLGVGDE
jgi:hypothetical protein